MGFWLLLMSDILHALSHQNLRFAPFREGANKTKIFEGNSYHSPLHHTNVAIRYAKIICTQQPLYCSSGLSLQK